MIKESYRLNKSNMVQFLKECFIIIFIFLLLSSCTTTSSKETFEEDEENNTQIDNSQLVGQEILPQTERLNEEDLNETNIEDNEISVNPFLGPLKLTGVLISSNDTDNLAIIESNSGSYIVELGDTVADYWTVEKIDQLSVVLKGDSKELVLDQEFSLSTKIQENNLDSNEISLYIKESDIRDVLSAIAIHMDSSIIFLEEPMDITFSIDNTTPISALELILQSNNLSYIEDDDLIIVGQVDNLQDKFFNQMMLTRFDLKYIYSDDLKSLISDLGVDSQIITVKENPQSIWIQGTPQVLSKIKELIRAVDNAENSKDMVLFPFALNNISAADAAERLELFNFEDVKTITFNYPEFGKDIMVICPAHQKTKVIRALEGLDWRGLDQEPQMITLPIDSATGSYAYAILRGRRELLKEIIDGLKTNPEAIRISNIMYNDAGEEYRVLLVTGSPDFIQLVKDTVELIKSP